MEVKFSSIHKIGKKSEGGKRHFTQLKNIYFRLAKANILEKSLKNFRLLMCGIKIFISSENWQKVGGRQEQIALLQKISTSL
ncbi:MAG: hypothetical protein AAGJ08_05675 [Cyanobacteria bacterium P01_H01_bin.35]